MIIAIDGPAGAGKSTVAQAVASALGFQYINTGAIYRTLALVSGQRGVDWGDAAGLKALAEGLEIAFVMRGDVNTVNVSVDGEASVDVTDAIRAPEISRGSSQVSAHPGVREALLGLQRQFGRNADSLLDGRDIGTVVFPDAELKIFLTASALERAKRRRKQLLESAADSASVPSLESIVEEIEARDARDMNRAIAPLKAAEDAVTLDTTSLPFEAVVARIMALAGERGSVGAS